MCNDRTCSDASANLLAEVVRGDPRHSLPFDLCLEVYSFDGEEHLSERL